MDKVATQSEIAEEAAQMSLHLGRLLLSKGADTAHIHNAVGRLANALGYKAHFLVPYEAMLVTIDVEGAYHTRVGKHAPASSVDMTAVEMLNIIVDESMGDSLQNNEVDLRLSKLEHRPPLY